MARKSRLRLALREVFRASASGPGSSRAQRVKNTLETVVESNSAYRKSFNRQLPPSTFVSERDRLRFGQAVPVSERLIGDTAARRELKRDLDQL